MPPSTSPSACSTPSSRRADVRRSGIRACGEPAITIGAVPVAMRTAPPDTQGASGTARWRPPIAAHPSLTAAALTSRRAGSTPALAVGAASGGAPSEPQTRSGNTCCTASSSGPNAMPHSTEAVGAGADRPQRGGGLLKLDGHATAIVARCAELAIRSWPAAISGARTDVRGPRPRHAVRAGGHGRIRNPIPSSPESPISPRTANGECRPGPPAICSAIPSTP
jgi:hypothetical protein